MKILLRCGGKCRARAVLRSRYLLVGAGVKVRLHLKDKTEEILNDILFVSSHIDKRLVKKRSR